ncbi:MAG: glycoside hydrolase family 13 protein [Nocardioides sp.]
MSSAAASRPWWYDAVVYEVYPRSFADGDADGEGDLAGLTERLPYLADLGVDALWVAPWYSSPMADGGYDVCDYRAIHPRFGTLADADRLIERAHALGLRVLIDLVANHTSSAHAWFREACVSAPGSAARSRYVFRDGRGPDGELPPNNWISAFGGSAWTRVREPGGRMGQWYLHTFAAEQPDLDWRSPEVGAEFDDVLRFWLDRGVDGFRVDAAAAMMKEPGLPDAEYGDDGAFTATRWVGNPHWDVDEVHVIFRRWRALVDSYPGDRVLVAEAVVNGPERLARYLRPDELHTAFNFDYLYAGWDAKRIREVVDTTLAALSSVGATPTWALSSHDEVRPATRLASSGHDGWARARAAALLTLALPGSAYVYQGDELGLPEVEDLPDDVLQDPVFTRSQGRLRGRDGCRVPLPWSGEQPPFGFSCDGTPPWLPQPPEWSGMTAQSQTGRPGSTLELYREALNLRRRAGTDQTLRWLGHEEDVIDFRRGSALRCVVNLGRSPHRLSAEPTLASAPVLPGNLLPPDAAAWIFD